MTMLMMDDDEAKQSNNNNLSSFKHLYSKEINYCLIIFCRPVMKNNLCSYFLKPLS